MVRRAEVTLQHEREWLAAQLKAAFSEDDRAQLFARWHIKQYKERKKALSLRLWDPSVRRRCRCNAWCYVAVPHSCRLADVVTLRWCWECRVRVMQHALLVACQQLSCT